MESLPCNNHAKHPRNCYHPFALILSIFLTISAGCAIIPENQPLAGTLVPPTATLSTYEQTQMELLETAHALATKMAANDPIATAAAIATLQIGSENNESGTNSNTVQSETISPTDEKRGPDNSVIPSDIPLPEGDLDNFHGSLSFISYSTTSNLNAVSEFYITQMQINKWNIVDTGTFITENIAQLQFTKEEKKASVTINDNPISESVSVVITIQNQ